MPAACGKAVGSYGRPMRLRQSFHLYSEILLDFSVLVNPSDVKSMSDEIDSYAVLDPPPASLSRWLSKIGRRRQRFYNLLSMQPKAFETVF